jgi:hypothetical protein
MNTIKTVIGVVAAAALSFGAIAQTQTPSTTEEAREAASKAMYAAAQKKIFEKPVLEDVFPGDYQAEWRNEARVANYYRFHRELEAYANGVRSTPIAVDSSVSAQDEAARVRDEQEWAGYVAYLRTSPAAQVQHRLALSEQGWVAAK